MSGPETVDAEVVAEGQELVPAEVQPATLFRTDDPVEVLSKATEVANALKGVLQKQGLTQKIQGREHVRVEGWQTLGAMLGVTGVCVWTRKLENGWEARVEARTLDGRVIGAAEAECLRTESTWKSRDDYALRSMAQTRATSKALGAALRFVVTLAGYEGTPAEEMTSPPPEPPKAEPMSDEQKQALLLLQEANFADPEKKAIGKWGFENGQLRPAAAQVIVGLLADDVPTGAEKLLVEIGYEVEAEGG